MCLPAATACLVYYIKPVMQRSKAQFCSHTILLLKTNTRLAGWLVAPSSIQKVDWLDKERRQDIVY